MADFHEYYSGRRVAPYLTIFIGGNHEASNHLFELYYGGWVAPNIYYLGAANVIRLGPVRIAALSGIWKGYDYRKPHIERLPYSQEETGSIYHVRELDVRKLLSLRSQVDIGLSHDWPQGIEWCGDYEWLFRTKRGFQEDANTGKLGSIAARQCLDRLRPPYWFSAHLHTKYGAILTHASDKQVDTAHLSRLRESPRPNAEPQGNAISNLDARPSLKRQREVSNSEGDAGKRTSTPPTNLSANQLDGSSASAVTTPKPVLANPDSIDIDMSDEDEPTPVSMTRHKPMPTTLSFTQEKNGSPASLNLPPSQSARGSYSHGEDADAGAVAPTAAQPVTNDAPHRPLAAEAAHVRDEQRPTRDTTNGTGSENNVSDEMRAQLAALSGQFARRDKFEVSPALPFPDEITNKVTRFLALGKCEPFQEFLQLLEIESITTPDQPIIRPLKLRYDREWLAILRVFAPELALGGSPNDKVPPHRGETYYRNRILEEQKWIEDHVVQPGLLEIPENFTVTSPVYDPNLHVDPTEMPREVTNPQTAAFCKLIGIENAFDIGEDERDARMAQGPRAESASFREYHTRPRGGRGGGGFRNHGGNRGGGGNRGRRGRGWRGN